MILQRNFVLFVIPFWVFALQFSTIQFALAHGTGATTQQLVGEYTISIDFSPTVLDAGSPATFAFELERTETNEFIDFTDIWVRVVQGHKTFFATGVHKPQFGRTVMTYTFPDAGEYEIFVRFQNVAEPLAETSFPVIIEEAESEEGSSRNPFTLLSLVFAGVFGLLVGSLATFLFKK